MCATSSSPLDARPRRVQPGSKAVVVWLYVCAAMIVLIIVVGGLTRLTESGLSIVEWKPIDGVVPPMTEAEWEAEFEKYKGYPEFTRRKDMTLAEFKFIYYLEWGHRVLGRAVGMAFFLPFMGFAAARKIPKGLHPQLWGLFALGGLQGVIGWLMVKSGLEAHRFEDGSPVRVSQYRLALHLSTALMLYMGILWTAWSVRQPLPLNGIRRLLIVRPALGSLARTSLGWICVTATTGAFVAGLDAGLIYDSFPKMGGQFIPSDLLPLEPVWRNFFEHNTCVQFIHRWAATAGVGMVAATTYIAHGAPLPAPVGLALRCSMGMVLVQATLGISTLLFHVPTELASAHQAGSVALLTCLLRLAFTLRTRPARYALAARAP